MPQYCCVPECKSLSGGHKFPSDKSLRQKWIVAVRRVDPAHPGKLWRPSKHSVVCHQHFLSTDYVETLLGKFEYINNILISSLIIIIRT